MSEWQPIETAPKGARVLLWATNRRPYSFIGDWGDFCIINQPRITHWMPLPAPPAAQLRRVPSSSAA